ncbi:hypothetical protein [Pseudomonas phage D6]|nr:hypothetical protein [Pseudomonas phage D6]
MCHMYPDPDKIIADIQEAIAKEVIDAVMEKHYQKPVPQPLRATHMGLVFHVTHPVDLRSESLAGQRIIKELNSLGFIGVEFYDSRHVDGGTIVEYTLATLEKFEEYQRNLETDAHV